MYERGGCDGFITKPVGEQQLCNLLSLTRERRANGTGGELLTPHNLYSRESSIEIEDEAHLLNAEILVVEDNRVNREYAIEVLSRLRCRVTTAADGEEALAIVTRQPFDLIFMDCQMPRMDGFEASTQLQNMAKRGYISAIPIIALTANAMKGDRERCIASGMCDYVAKPVRKQDLIKTLNRWLPPLDQRVSAKMI